jgi:hypothetical protein
LAFFCAIAALPKKPDIKIATATNAKFVIIGPPFTPCAPNEMPLSRYQKVNHPLLNRAIGSSDGLDVVTYHKPSGDSSNKMSLVSSNH